MTSYAAVEKQVECFSTASQLTISIVKAGLSCNRSVAKFKRYP